MRDLITMNPEILAMAIVSLNLSRDQVLNCPQLTKVYRAIGFLNEKQR